MRAASPLPRPSADAMLPAPMNPSFTAGRLVAGRAALGVRLAEAQGSEPH